MKRVLFSLLAMFAVGSLWAQGEVTETDLSGFRDVVYAKSITVMQGTEEVNLPIWSKTHAGFVGVSFYVEVPQKAKIKYTGSLSDDSYDHTQTINLASWTGNQKDDGYMVIGALASTEHGTDNQLGFYSGDHELGTIVIDVSALEVGTYPIKIKNIEMSKFLDGEANVSITGEIVSTLTIIDRITLDENETELPQEVDNVNVKVKRTINANEWSTICLPFAMTAEQVAAAFPETTVELADFTDAETINNNIKVKFTSVNPVVIDANHPYIIKVSKTVSEFDVDGVDIDPQEAIINKGSNRIPKEFIGNYIANTVLGVAKGEKDENPILFISGGKFYASWGTAKIKAFRAYFNIFDLYDVLSTDADAKLGFFVDDETTAIEGINTNQRVVEGVYDLQGRKVMVKDGDINNLQRGLYIINGKKVAIK